MNYQKKIIKALKTLAENMSLPTVKPEWGYLIHRTQSKEDRESIIKNGFKIGTNKYILPGVYTVPDYNPGAFFGLQN